MFWPTVVSHKIDDESPLWDFSARTIARFAKQLIFYVCEYLVVCISVFVCVFARGYVCLNISECASLSLRD